MVQYLERDKEYPFLFSMRAVFNFMSKNQLQYIEDASTQVQMDYDSLLGLYSQASKAGAKKDNSDLELDAEALEEMIDEDPSIFMELQEMFQESSVMKTFQGRNEEKAQSADKKK